jgi:ADP-ribose pyrophosphatase YjhB (NUDIX family)
MGRKPVPNSTSHTVVAVAMRVHGGRLEALLRRVDRLPRESLARALERAIDVGALAHLEQLETRVLRDGTLATFYLGLARPGTELTGDWRPAAARTPADERELVAAAQARLRAKLSYTNLGFALAPEVFTISELRELYVAALGHDVSATNLKRVLLRRNVLATTGARREPGRTGGRPAEVYRFRNRTLEITDPFATLRPPG